MRRAQYIADLVAERERREHQLTTVCETVYAINADGNVGSALGTSLPRLLEVTGATGAMLWMPGQHPNDWRLVECHGLSRELASEELRQCIQKALATTVRRATVEHVAHVDGKPVQLLSFRLGAQGSEDGLCALVLPAEGLESTERAIATAIISDLAWGLRSIRLIGEARRLADKDSITGISNHRAAQQRLAAELARAQRTDNPLSVVILDLDNFKLLNDTYGHPVGDEILRRVSDILRKSCRNSDIIGRYGGDEFILVLPDANQAEAMVVVDRVRTLLAREKFRAGNSATLPIAAAFGLAVFPEDAKSLTELMALATTNLREAKQKGAGTVTVTRRSEARDETVRAVDGFDMIQAMVVAVDNKDRYTRRHSEEVTEYSVKIARAMGHSEEFIERLRLSALLHDVGKIGVPDEILRKPGHLSNEEFAIMKQHPALGALIVGSLPNMRDLVDGIRFHHERWDGRGYPDGLAGEQIPLMGRIMAVADAYSAMTTTRPYRQGLPVERALDELRKGMGQQFDPEPALVFVRLVETEMLQPAAEPEPLPKRRAPRKSSSNSGKKTDGEAVAA